MPFVPVTAATASSADGSPKNRLAAAGIARRTLGTTSCGTGSRAGRSTTSADRTASTACGASSCPSTCDPGTQKKSEPGTTARVS